ncbi:hypothetical protein [Actinomadura meridiana]
MNAIYIPFILVFAVFLIYGGVVMPVMEIVDSFRGRTSRAVE